EHQFGPRHAAVNDPCAGGLKETWTFGFDCGLQLLVTHHRDSKDGRRWELEGNLLESQHALCHLGLPADCVTWRGERLRIGRMNGKVAFESFELWRLDDNGNQALVDVLGSEKTAACIATMYEARGHKQTYFVKRSSP
ncbi:MAG TPA: hypothetical protein VMK12_10815, partial [Anaeromyxobacteraceae bacterium]|nr:hypothetical protein [Anaeromyxobacteraceae bacterium]